MKIKVKGDKSLETKQEQFTALGYAIMLLSGANAKTTLKLWRQSELRKRHCETLIGLFNELYKDVKECEMED